MRREYVDDDGDETSPPDRLRPVPPQRRRRLAGLLTTALALCSIAVAACGGVKDSPSDPTTPTGPSTPTAPSTPSTGVALNDDFSGRALFPSDNWWNQDITSAPLDPQSNAYHRLHRPHADAASRLRSAAVRHSLRRRRRQSAARAGHVRRLRQRERSGFRRRDRLSDSRRGEDAAELHRRRRARRRHRAAIATC